MAEFWNSGLTQRSWETLTKLPKQGIRFILIGGWATYLLTRINKSRDIDIVLSSVQELDVLKGKHALSKNDTLKKYQIKIDDVEIDIYAPYYSKLSIPCEDLPKYTQRSEGFTLPKPEAMVILKQQAELERSASPKGLKDRIDIMSLLLYSAVDFQAYYGLTEKYGLKDYPARLKQIVNTFGEGQYLNLNPRELKVRKREVLSRLK
ncbi:hypothetical protein HYY74_02325 [Candidatus Woesearchaeota archaeon]|nr:hypothetical protein [Candidatus Woesearchaeota archaeon]